MTKIISNWRISRGDPSGLLLWFDPLTEVPLLRELTKGEQAVKLDSIISVGALDEDEDGVSSLDQLEIPFGGSLSLDGGSNGET